MILLIGIDAPQIVLLSKDEITHCQHARKHGVVLIIVPMKTVTTNSLKIFEAADELFQSNERILIIRIVNRIRLRNAKDTTIVYVVVTRETDALHFVLSQFHKIRIRHIPQLIAFSTKILH